jgi:hypothetical protein
MLLLYLAFSFLRKSILLYLIRQFYIYIYTELFHSLFLVQYVPHEFAGKYLSGHQFVKLQTCDGKQWRFRCCGHVGNSNSAKTIGWCQFCIGLNISPARHAEVRHQAKSCCAWTRHAGAFCFYICRLGTFSSTAMACTRMGYKIPDAKTFV